MAAAGQPAESRPGPAPGLLLAGAAAVGALLLLLAPVLAHPATRLLGRLDSEGPEHARKLAATVAGLPVLGPFRFAVHPLDVSEGLEAVGDPLSVFVIFAVSRMTGGGTAGFTLGWNLLHALVVLGVGAGAWLWVRAWLGEEDRGRWAAGTAAALAMLGPYVMGAPDVGRTESLYYPLVVLHGGLLLQAARRGGAWWLPAAASPVLLVWSGGYGCVFLLLVEPFLVALALRWAPRRGRALAGLALVQGVALLAGWPLIHALRAHPPMALRGTRPGAGDAAAEVLLGFTARYLDGVAGYEVAPWLGGTALVLAGVAALRRRSVLVPLGLALALAVLALGPRILVGQTLVPGPAGVLEALPGPFGEIRGWCRIGGMAGAVLAVAAGAAALRRPSLAVVVVILAGLEAGLHRPWPPSSFSVTSGVEVPALAAGRAVVELPLDEVRFTRRWLAPTPRPDPWALGRGNAFTMGFHQLVPNRPRAFDAPEAEPDAESLARLRADAWLLRQAGVEAVVLRDRDWMPGQEHRARLVLDGALCPGDLPRSWRLPTGPAGGCGAPTPRPSSGAAHPPEPASPPPPPGPG